MKMFLFTADVEQALLATRSGVDGVMLDWEKKPAGYDKTRGELDSVEDLRRLSERLELCVAVRINGDQRDLSAEVQLALENGAQYIMLPMARNADDVSRFFDCIGGRAKTIVQIETTELLEELSDLRALEWDYAFIGLLDLAHAMGTEWIWQLFEDGTVEAICKSLEGRKVGVGGITIASGGEPVPFALLLGEMVRLNCALAFMRRCFKRDIGDRDFEREFGAIKALVRAAQSRGPEAVASDHARFLHHLSKLKHV